MHGAPSVSYPVGRSRFAAAFIVSASCLAAGGIATWAIQVQPTFGRMLLAATVTTLATLLAIRSWLRSEQGVLSWDGDGWSWAVAGAVESGTPAAVLDFQRVLLLRWKAETLTVRWLWAERDIRPSSWDDLRRAVYSRARCGGAGRQARGEART
jgi:hypothetical protein